MAVERTSYLDEVEEPTPIIQPPIDQEIEEPVVEVQGVNDRNLMTKASDLFFRDVPTALLRSSETLLNAPFELLGSSLPGGDPEEAKDNLWDIMAGKRGMSPNIERALFGWRRGITMGWDPTSDLPEDETGGFAGAETPKWVGDMFKTTGEIGGNVMAIAKANKVAGTFLGWSGKMTKLATNPTAIGFSMKFPKALPYAKMLLQGSLGFGLFGQAQKDVVKADWKTKAEQLKNDMQTGFAFSAIGGIGFRATRGAVAQKFTGIKQVVTNAIVEYPTMFGLGYVDTYHRDPNSTQEERIENGLTLAFLHGVLGLADKPMRQGKEFKNIHKTQIDEAIRRVPEMLEGEAVSNNQKAETRAVDRLSSEISKTGKELTLPKGFAETKVPVEDIGRVRRWIGSIYPMAEQLEAKTGLPFYSKWYRGIENAAVNTTQFRVWSDQKIAEFLPPKQWRNAPYMEKVGELGVALDEANVSTKSARGQKIASDLGLGQKELDTVFNFQKFWSENYFPLAKQMNPKLKFKDNYWPKLEDFGRRESVGAAFGEFVPDEVMFNVGPRGGTDVSRIKNPIVLNSMYANTIAKKAFYQVPLDTYSKLKQHLPPRLRKRFDEFMNTNIGKVDRSPGIVYDFLSGVDQKINSVLAKVNQSEFGKTKIGKELKVNTANSAVDIANLLNTSAYASAIGGANLRPTGLQFVQALQLGVPEFGMRGVPYILKGYKNATDPAVWERAKQGGWIQSDFLSDGAIRAYDKFKSSKGRASLLYATDATRFMLEGIKKGDAVSRVVIGDAAWHQFNDSLQIYRNKGFEAFSENLGLAEGKSLGEKLYRPKFSDPLVREIEGFLKGNDIPNARESYIRYRLRNTNFSQLPGEFPESGLREFGGRSLYMLQTFPLHALNTFVNRWSPSQKASYIGMGLVLTQAFRKLLGVDLKRSFGAQDLAGPLLEVQLVYANMFKTALDWGAASLEGWDRSTDEAKDEFIKSLGVWTNQPKRLARVKKSLENNYAILDSKGKIIEYGNPLTTFMQLIGFTPNEVAIFYEESRLGSNAANKHQNKRAELLELQQIDNEEERTKKTDGWLKRNPDYLYLMSDPAFLEQIFKSRREGLDEMNGIPQWLQPQLLDDKDKINKWF